MTAKSKDSGMSEIKGVRREAGFSASAAKYAAFGRNDGFVGWSEGSEG
jgi:hypothetical protein